MEQNKREVKVVFLISLFLMSFGQRASGYIV